jgi:phage terminase large subunit-like protein
MTAASWESVYQQSPIIVGGGIFPIDNLVNLDRKPSVRDIRKAVRYWDKAGTEDGGAFTAGVLMLLLHDGEFVVADVQHFQHAYGRREKQIKKWSELDKSWLPNYEVWVEQEPGSGGKESAERSVTMLAGIKAYADKVTGDKEARAEDSGYAAQIQNKSVFILADPRYPERNTWQPEFLHQHEVFPNGPKKDIVDAAVGAFWKLTLGSTFDISNRWVDGDE